MRTHRHTHSSMPWPLHFAASMLPSLAFTAKAILREKNLTAHFSRPLLSGGDDPRGEGGGTSLLLVGGDVMSRFPHVQGPHPSPVLEAEILPPRPHPIRGGASHRVFFSSNLSTHHPSPTHTVSLSPGPLPSCLPYRGAPFSHHRPQTHVCKVHEDAQYTAEAVTGNPGGPGLLHVATSATHSPVQPTQVSFTGCRGQRLHPAPLPSPPPSPTPVLPSFLGRGHRSPGQCVFSQEPFTWLFLSPCFSFRPPQPASTPPSPPRGDVT